MPTVKNVSGTVNPDGSVTRYPSMAVSSDDPCHATPFVEPVPVLPEHLVVRYTKCSITFTDGEGHEFRPRLTDALEVIRVMSEYASRLAFDLAQREHNARDLAGQLGRTEYLRDVAARRGASSDPWAPGDQKYLTRMAEHGEEIRMKGEEQAKKEFRDR